MGIGGLLGPEPRQRVGRTKRSDLVPKQRLEESESLTDVFNGSTRNVFCVWLLFFRSVIALL